MNIMGDSSIGINDFSQGFDTTGVATYLSEIKSESLDKAAAEAYKPQPLRRSPDRDRNLPSASDPPPPPPAEAPDFLLHPPGSHDDPLRSPSFPTPRPAGSPSRQRFHCRRSPAYPPDPKTPDGSCVHSSRSRRRSGPGSHNQSAPLSPKGPPIPA